MSPNEPAMVPMIEMVLAGQGNDGPQRRLVGLADR
jgi:hypothetical protein